MNISAHTPPTLRQRLGYLLLLSTAVSVGCAKTEDAAPLPRPALAYTISSQAGADADVYPGEIRARHEADHAFRIGGKIIARFVEQGSTVRRGQAIARLDPQDTKLAQDSAEATVAAAKTEATFADAELKRFRDLFQKGFVSQSALDQKINVANAAAARFESARAQANVVTNQAAYATLSAEQDGVVTLLQAEAGQVVAAGQPVARIANPAEKELIINVPESKLATFRSAGTIKPNTTPARQVRIATTAAPTHFYDARVREIGAAADAVTRTYPVRISIMTPDSAVQLGMSAYAVFVGANAEASVSVPLSAILVKNNTTSVWHIGADGKVSLRAVTVIEYRENAALVRGNIAAGERIVAAGVHKLREGEIVKPIVDPKVTGDGKVAVITTSPSNERIATR